MNDRQKRGPLVPLAKLRRYVNAKGEPYLSGFMGPAKVLVLPNRERQDERDASHVLFVTEAPKREPGR